MKEATNGKTVKIKEGRNLRGNIECSRTKLYHPLKLGIDVFHSPTWNGGK